jgi:hypothetical protein
MAEIAGALSPAELALYGRRIAHFFLKIEKAKKSGTQMYARPQNTAPWALAGKPSPIELPVFGGSGATYRHPFPVWLPTGSESGRF